MKDEDYEQEGNGEGKIYRKGESVRWWEKGGIENVYELSLVAVGLL